MSIHCQFFLPSCQHIMHSAYFFRALLYAVHPSAFHLSQLWSMVFWINCILKPDVEHLSSARCPEETD